jgi:hypothetical protein
MPVVTKKLLEGFGYKDVHVYDKPVILLNGVPMAARRMVFLDENELKKELDPQCPVVMIETPADEAGLMSEKGLTIRLFKPIRVG